MKNQLTKGLTIALFSTSIIAFVAYRAGYFTDQSDYSSDGMESENAEGTDMMPSSKYVIVDGPVPVNVEEEESTVDSLQDKEPQFMYSSKSATIVQPEEFNIILDSIDNDSVIW